MVKDNYTFSMHAEGGKSVDQSSGSIDNLKLTSQSHSKVDIHDTETPVVAFEPDIKADNKKEEDEKSVSFFQMFRFADCVDVTLIILGTVAAIGQGLAIPLNFLVYGEVATGFMYYTQLTAGNLSNPNFTARLMFDPNDYDDLLGRTQGYALYFCLIAVSVIITGTIQFTCWGIAAERQMKKIKRTFFAAVLHQDIGWFDIHDAGSIASSFNENMHGVAEGIGQETSVFIQWLVTCVGSYIVALVKGWKLALACLAFSPVIILIGAVFVRYVKTVASREAKAYAAAGSIAEESLSSIKTVMAFNGQKKESQRYRECLGKAADSATLKGLAVGIGMGSIWFIMYCVLSLSFWYADKLMSENEPGFEPGTVLTIFFGVMIGSMSLGQAFPILETIGNGRAAAAKIFSIIDKKPTIQKGIDKGDKPASVEGNVEFRNVRFTYPARPDTQVLKGLSFLVQKGQTVALVGSSGSGKSTVVQLVERFYDTQEGQVLLDGRNIKDLNVRWLRDQIGLVSQEPVLFATTISDNIQYGRADVTIDDIKQAAIKANAHDFISALPKGYDTLVGDRGAQLSGGQKQRIAIARALVRDPKILLLDEATSALDNESEAVVQQALEKAQEGRTTLVIAHRLSTIQNADLIIVMQDGEFVEQGRHSELMQMKGLYHKLVEHQMQTDVSNSGAELDIFQKSPVFDRPVTEELEQDLLDPDEVGADEKSPLTIRRQATKVDRTFSVSSQKEEVEGNREKREENSEDLPTFSMKRILRLNAPEWYLIAIGCLFSIIVGAIQPALAYMLSEFLTVFTGAGDSDNKTTTLVAISMGIAVCNSLLRVALALCFARAGSRLTRRIRMLTFESMMKQDMTFYDDPRHRVGLLTTRLSSDATVVQGAAGSKIGLMLESVSTIIAAVVVAMLSTWKLSLVILAFLPLMVAMGIMQGKLVSGFSKSDKISLEKAGQIVSESVENMRLVQSLSREHTFMTMYNTLIEGICSKAMRRSVILSLLLGLSTSVMFFSYAAAFTYGAYLVQYDGLDFQLVFRAFAAVIFGGMMVGRNSTNAPDFSKAKMACRRLFALIDKVPDIDVSKDEGKIIDKCSGRLDFSNVTFHYPSRSEVRVLHDLGFTVMPGETVALVGTSGCGKSTTVSLIERFYDPVSGVVRVDQEDLRNLNLKWMRSQIGFVSQEPVLFDCTIAENIAYGDNSRVVPMDEIIAAARSANIHSFITQLPEGYETNVGSKGTQLSGGQKQRVAIARALVSNPKILLLDEATSALDSESEKVVQAALDQAREGRTSLVIAHRLSTIQNADKIVIFHKGAVVESGTHAELLARKEVYYKLTLAQNRNKKS